MAVMMRRNNIALLINPPEGELATSAASASSISIYLPTNRETVKRIVQIYFTNLNFHRPVYSRRNFEQRLESLYENRAGSHDPGFICSLYLILALGTMCEINSSVAKRMDGNSQEQVNLVNAKQVMPSDWPDHEAFFERALTIKPDLRVTLSSLQALILLHWYLYTEVSSTPSPSFVTYQ
jgi:hypothetical protein